MAKYRDLRIDYYITEWIVYMLQRLRVCCYQQFVLPLARRNRSLCGMSLNPAFLGTCCFNRFIPVDSEMCAVDLEIELLRVVEDL